jgi:hypothetical protein
MMSKNRFGDIRGARFTPAVEKARLLMPGASSRKGRIAIIGEAALETDHDLRRLLTNV